MTVKNLVLMKIYITPEEKAHLQELAKRTEVSLSDLGRRLLVGRPVPDQQSKKDLMELLKCNADLARLGNLFKMALDNEEFVITSQNRGQNTDDLIKEIKTTQDQLKSLIADLKAA